MIDNELHSLLAKIRADLIRSGSIKPSVTIDGETGRVRRRGRPPKMMSQGRKAPPPTPSITPPSAVRRGKKKDRVPAHLKTERGKEHHDWSAGGGAHEVVYRVQGATLRNLTRWGCLDGGHVHLFLKDWEAVNASIRSPDLMGASGGGFGSKTVPDIVLSAQTRLKALSAYVGEGPFSLLVAVIVLGAGPAELHAAGGEQHVVVSHQIREAVNALASFYTPGLMRTNRTWEAAQRVINSRKKVAGK